MRQFVNVLACLGVTASAPLVGAFLMTLGILVEIWKFGTDKIGSDIIDCILEKATEACDELRATWRQP